MAITTTSVASSDATRAFGRSGRTDGDQGGLPGGFAAMLGAAETAAAPPVPEAEPPKQAEAVAPDTETAEKPETDAVKDADNADGKPPAPRHGKRRTAGADGAPAATAAPAVVADAASTQPAAADGSLTTAMAAVAAAAAASATTAGTSAAGAAGAAGTGKVAGVARGANPVAADPRTAATGASRPGPAAVAPGDAAAATAAARTGARQSVVAADAAVQAQADGTGQVPAATTADPLAQPTVPALPVRSGVSAAAAADASRTDAVPLYQSNFARMQQALAHAPAGGKGAAADAANTMAQDLGAVVTGLSGTTPAAQATASTVSLADGASRVGGNLAELMVLQRPADIAGAGAGRPGDSGGQAARDGQGDSGAGNTVPAAALGFGATAALDANNWNNGFSTTAAADATAGADTRSAEDVLADQIGNWVHQKTQSAELTLDAFGGSPVDVRISMTGSEAQVAFQSDSEATRQLLGGAVDQLRELLQSQGLVLSGVSVGGSGASQGGGQSGAREGGSGGRGRGATAAVGATAEAAASPRNTAASQRAVDVFI